MHLKSLLSLRAGNVVSSSLLPITNSCFLCNSAVQQLQSSLRDEKASLRSLREAVDKIEHNTIAALVDAKSANAANRAAIDDLQGQFAGLHAEAQQMSGAVRTQAEGARDFDNALRAQREHLVQLESTLCFR